MQWGNIQLNYHITKVWFFSFTHKIIRRSFSERSLQKVPYNLRSSQVPAPAEPFHSCSDFDSTLFIGRSPVSGSPCCTCPPSGSYSSIKGARPVANASPNPQDANLSQGHPQHTAILALFSNKFPRVPGALICHSAFLSYHFCVLRAVWE